MVKNGKNHYIIIAIMFFFFENEEGKDRERDRDKQNIWHLPPQNQGRKI